MGGRVNRDWFYKLASDLEDERVSSAVSLIKELSELQLPDDADEWSYVLKRLINGLASGRNSARLGFSLCLTEVVNLALAIEDESAKPQELSSIDKFFDLLSNTLSIDTSNGNEMKKTIKGKDERGLLFGKMFALQALLNEPVFSQVFIENGKINGFAIRFMDELALLATKKAWLREPCLFTLFRTIKKLIDFIDIDTMKEVFELLDKYQLTLTNEGLAIYLLFSQNFPSETSAVSTTLKLRSKTWKSNDPLSRGNLPLLSQILKNSGLSQEDEDAPTTKNTNWNPRLHFVWDILLPHIATSSAAPQESTSDRPPVKKRKKEKTASLEFPEFWKAAVDETFFNDKASSERKYLGFLIFDKTLPIISPDLIHCCFSQNFMRSLINQSSDNKRLLHKMAQKTLQKVINACECNPSEKLVPCLNAILFGVNGSINFDKLTKTKTVSKLISLPNLTVDTLEELLQSLTAQLSNESQIPKSETQFLLDTLLHIIRSHKLEINGDLRMKPLLQPFVRLAFFSKEAEDISQIAKDRLYSILSELSTVENKLYSPQYQALEIIHDEECMGKDLINPLDENLQTIKMESLRILEDVSKDLRDPQNRGLECLLSMSILEMYMGVPESVSIIQELCEFQKKKQSTQSTSMVGLTEILLSLLAQKKSLFRKLSLQVWQQYIDSVGKEEIMILLDVLGARENKKGFSQLFRGDDEDGTEDDDGEEDMSDNEGISDDYENEDDEITEATKEGKTQDVCDFDDEVSESSDENDNYDSNEDRDDIAKIDKEATSELAKALNVPENIFNEKGEVDFNQLGGESEESDGDDEMESMDDEMMMQLDGQLSEIFKRRKEALTSANTGNDRKIEAKESRESVITFKHRITDMLEIYVKDVEKKIQNNSMSKSCFSNLLLLIEPMIDCIRETVDKSLALRISKLLKGKAYKTKPSEFYLGVENPDDLFEMLKFTHKKLLTKKPGMYQVIYYSVCSTTSLFLAKVLVHLETNDNGKEAAGRIIDLYTDTLKKWTDQGKFGPNIFIDLVNWLATRKHATQA